jgi:hypothetical protein
VRAINEGGKAESDRVLVTYVPMWTVEVKFDHLERRDRDGGDKFSLNEKAPVGEMVLHGHVEYRYDDASLKAPAQVSCWVNDFRQSDALLGPAEGRVRKFALPILLNREKNVVAVQLPTGLKVKGDEPHSREVACAKPTTTQRLHLLIVGPGNPDQKKLADDVLAAFGVEKDDKGRLKSEAFSEVLLYGPLESDVTDLGIRNKLINLRARLRKSPTSDVVVVFFAGEERVQKKKHYLLTKASLESGDLNEAVEVGALRDLLAGVRGAKLLLLDAQRKKGDKGEDAPSADPRQHLGGYRYVWLGDDPAPEKARLAYALSVALARKSQVREQRQILEEWAGGFGDKAAFHWMTPPALELLRLR